MLARWALVAACVAGARAPAVASAQTVTVQGQVQVQPYGQPQGYAQPPPGYTYGQPTYAPTYGQPAYAQPVYAQPGYPTYPAPVRQVRYEQRETTIKGLWIPGAIIFGASWALTGSVASIRLNTDYATYAWIPLVGPWLMLSVAGSDDEIAGALLGGITQVAGLTMFALGLALHETVRVAVYSLGDDPRAPQLALSVQPALAGGMATVTLTHF